MRVEILDAGVRERLEGTSAIFYLHPTFGRAVRQIKIRRGIARLDVLAWGAFTVGVLLDDGTKLELDLAELSSAPKEFREA